MCLTGGGGQDPGLLGGGHLGVPGARPQGQDPQGGGLLSPLGLALVGEQEVDVVLLQGAGGAAGRAHAQEVRQLPPLLVLIHLRTKGCSLPSHLGLLADTFTQSDTQ